MWLIKNRPIVIQFLLLFPGIVTAALEPRTPSPSAKSAHSKRGILKRERYIGRGNELGIRMCLLPTPGVYTRVPAYARAIDGVIKGRSTELKGAPESGEAAVLGDSGKQSGGGAFNIGWWAFLTMLGRRLRGRFS